MPATIHGRTLAQLRATLSQLDAVLARRPTLRSNPVLAGYAKVVHDLPFDANDSADAKALLARFAP